MPGDEDTYISKNVIDPEICDSTKVQVNHSTLKAGKGLLGATHDCPYDEIYYFEPNVVILKEKKLNYFKLKIGVSEFNNGAKFEIIQAIFDGVFFRSFLNKEGKLTNHLAFFVQNIKE